MDEKILVGVYVPATGTSYDIFIPLLSKMCDVLGLLKKSVTEMSDGLFLADETTVVSWLDTGDILNINLSVYELGLHNGSKLMLV